MNFLHVTKNFIKNNSRTILIGTGFVALAGTVVTAVNAGRQLDETREAYLENKVNELSAANEELKAQLEKKAGLVIKKDEETGNEYYDLNAVGNVKATWKLFAPTAIFGTATAVCFGTVFHMDRKEIAKLGAACVGANKLLKHKDMVIDKMSDKLSDKQKDEVSKEVAKEELKNVKIPTTYSDGTQLFMDSFSKNVFPSTLEMIKDAEREFVANALKHEYDDFAPLWDFMDLAGIPHSQYSMAFGWAEECIYDESSLIYIVPGESDDGTPVWVINYKDLMIDASEAKGTYRFYDPA
jgi:hypothetical protein